MLNSTWLSLLAVCTVLYHIRIEGRNVARFSGLSSVCQDDLHGVSQFQSLPPALFWQDELIINCSSSPCLSLVVANVGIEESTPPEESNSCVRWVLICSHVQSRGLGQSLGAPSTEYIRDVQLLVEPARPPLLPHLGSLCPSRFSLLVSRTFSFTV